MYTESVPVTFPGGIHNGTLDALRQFGQHGLRLDGLDPSDWNNWDHLMSTYPARAADKSVETSVEHPDEQTARDIGLIAKHTIQQGRNLWPGREVPPEMINKAANAVRRKLGLPEEGGMETPTPAPVRNETTAMQKGSPYPENSAENAPDHSAPGHHLPAKVNEIYNACMRDNPGYGKEKCMKIAWAGSGKHHETKWTVVAEVKHACAHCSCDSDKCDCSKENPCGHSGCKFARISKLHETAVCPRCGNENMDIVEGSDGEKISCENCGWKGNPQDKKASVHEAEKKWIQKAIKRPGQLHKDLGVPEREDIPEEKLQEALNSNNPKVRQRAQFAENVKKGKNADPEYISCQNCGKKMWDDYKDDYTGKKICPDCAEKGVSKSSKWQIVSLGELQQPGGVGSTQDYNPVVDGPNPEGPSFDDNSGNSPEQEVALETWVNLAVDMINRGQDDNAILAQLAHDGCPQPEEVLQRAKQQPNQSPVNDQMGQDPFNAPPSEDPTQAGNMEGLSQQPPVTAAAKLCPDCSGKLDPTGADRDDDGNWKGSCSKCGTELSRWPAPGQYGYDADDEAAQEWVDKNSHVRIAGTSLTGTVIERWEDLWGQGLVKVALDDGGTMNVAPEAIESVEEHPRQPVSEIQEFINSLPEVQPTRPSIEARLTNLELVRRAVRSTINKVGFSDQVKLQQQDRWAENQALDLKEYLSAVHPSDWGAGGVAQGMGVHNDEARYVCSHGYPEGRDCPSCAWLDQQIKPDMEHVPTFDKNVREAAYIWASEGPWTDEEAWVDPVDMRFAAIRYAETHNLSGEQLNGFLKAAEEYVEQHRIVRTEEFSDEPEIDNEGPAEGLFL